MRAFLALWFCVGAGAQTLYINAGGPVTIATPSQPLVFQADQYFSGGSVWTDPTMGDGIWATLRYGPSFSYDVPFQNGLYNITLYLLEPNKTGPNQRVFTVTANGVLSNPIDIFAVTGSINKQTSITLLALVGNGHLRINFQATVGNAVVSAIEVHPSWAMIAVQQ